MKAREKNTGCSVRESESMTLVRVLSWVLVLSSKMTRNVAPSTSVVSTKSQTSSEIFPAFCLQGDIAPSDFELQIFTNCG